MASTDRNAMKPHFHLDAERNRLEVYGPSPEGGAHIYLDNGDISTEVHIAQKDAPLIALRIMQHAGWVATDAGSADLAIQMIESFEMYRDDLQRSVKPNLAGLDEGCSCGGAD